MTESHGLGDEATQKVDSTPAIELIHGDGSRSRYEADYAMGFVMANKSERIRVRPHDLEEAVRLHMWGMAFEAGRRS